MKDNVPHQATAAENQPSVGGKEAPNASGKTIGDFRLLRRLGQGGMGQVYLAEQISLRRKVAVKLLRGDLSADATALKRFETEALAVAKATHANIVQVYAVGEQDGVHYMALEYVEGRNLRDFLEKKGPPDILISIGIIRQVAAALQRASELGIIHRDIKPDNILVTRKGEVKVADFGLSRIFADDRQPLNLTQSGVTMGTPLYMSPEQVEGKTIDPRTDIYSLGVTAYHLLAGEPPFKGQTAFEVAVQHVQKEATPLQEIRPDLPPQICAVVHKMMAKRPEERYQTAQEIMRDLGQLRDVLVGVSATPPQTDYFSSPGPTASLPAMGSAHIGGATLTRGTPAHSRKRWLPWAALATLVLMLAAGIGLGWWMQRDGVALAGNGPAGDGNGSNARTDPLKEQERELIKTFDRLKNPTVKSDFAAAFHACMSLGLFYLKNDRIDKADRFFADLRNESRLVPFRNYGKLGKALVLAFRDRPQESNLVFKSLLIRKKGRGKRFTGRFAVGANPHLAEMVAKALQRNYDNDPEHFPSRLDEFRRPPPITVWSPPTAKKRRGRPSPKGNGK